MDSIRIHPDPEYRVAIDRCDRWLAEHRLQELGIVCSCSPEGGLSVAINSPLTAVQLWSTIRQLTTSRDWKLNWLKHCWNLTR
jgi:hypothetical protein